MSFKRIGNVKMLCINGIVSTIFIPYIIAILPRTISLYRLPYPNCPMPIFHIFKNYNRRICYVKVVSRIARGEIRMEEK